MCKVCMKNFQLNNSDNVFLKTKDWIKNIPEEVKQN